MSDGGELKDLQKSPGSNETISMQAISQSKYKDMMHLPTSPPGFFSFKMYMVGCVADRFVWLLALSQRLHFISAKEVR